MLKPDWREHEADQGVVAEGVHLQRGLVQPFEEVQRPLPFVALLAGANRGAAADGHHRAEKPRWR